MTVEKKTAQLFPENKNPFGTEKYKCAPGSHFRKSWGICGCMSIFLSMGAGNLAELRIMSTSLFVVWHWIGFWSPTAFSEVCETAQLLWAGQNIYTYIIICFYTATLVF